MTKHRLPPGISLSLGRAIGLAKAMTQASRHVGVPLSHQPRQRTLGASIGCCVILAVPTALVAPAIWQVIGG